MLNCLALLNSISNTLLFCCALLDQNSAFIDFAFVFYWLDIFWTATECKSSFPRSTLKVMCMQIFHCSWYILKVDLKPKFVLFTKSWGLLMGRRDVEWFVICALIFSDFDDQKHLLPGMKENRSVHTRLLNVFKEFRILQGVLSGQTHLATPELPYSTSTGFLRRDASVSSLTNSIAVETKNRTTNK